MLAFVLAAAITWPLGVRQTIPAPATPRAAATTFVDAFVHDDLALLRGLYARGADPATTVEFLEKYDCITVRAHAIDIRNDASDRATAVVQLDITGKTLGRSDASRLPEFWDLALVRDDDAWRIATAGPREQTIAASFLNAANNDERRCIIDAATRADRSLILRYAAFDGADRSNESRIADSIALAQTIAHEQNDLALESAIVRMRAYFAYSNSDGPGGVAFAEESVRIAEASGDVDALAVARFITGIAHWFNGNLPAAIAALDASGELVDQCADPRPVIKAIYMAGVILGHAGDVRNAIAHQSRALALSETYGWTEGVSAATIGLAAQWESLGHLDLVKLYALRAYRTALSIGQTDHAKMSLFTFATATASTGDERRGMELMRFVLEHEPPVGSSQQMQSIFAAHLIASNHLDEAATLLNGIVAADGWTTFDLLLARSSLALARHRYDDVLTAVNAAFDVAAQPSTGNADITAASVNKGRALLALGRTDEAFEVFRNAAQWIEEMREDTPSDEILRARFLVDRLQPYEALVALSIARGDPRTALTYAEKKRGRVLGDVLRRGHVDDGVALTAEEKAKESELTEKLAAANRALLATHDAMQRTNLERERDAARLALIAVRGELVAAHPRLRARQGTSDVDVLEHPRQLLREERAAIVLYDVQPEQTFAFVITRKADQLNITTTKIARSRRTLQLATQQLAFAIRQRDLGWSHESRAVYDLLLLPLEQQLAGCTSIIIVPDGPLWDVPFHALKERSGHVLLETHTISYAPSLATLAHDPSRQRPSQSVLAIGDPAVAPRAFEILGGDASYARLPDAAAEAEEISAMYAAGASEALVGEQATETAFKQKAMRYDVLHFATHGVLDRSPLHSALLLAPSDQDDGLLEAREILDLPLDADLAILSACDTGSGDFTPGEGVMGLSWAFMVAGCPTTIASHWQIGSSSSRELMTTFHRALRSEHLGPAAALRRAQLAMMKRPRYRHPIHWAGFVSIGAP